MAYFLPSYFQKRLLRYALTRLDFIETDALNLEDLDIILGQRSIIELKNVGIKVSQLIEKLHIPSAVSLKHASIRLLRITIPADLHISGIVVELDGIDIQVELKEDEKTSVNPSTAPARRGNVVDRPRIASPSLHDPGGSGSSRTSSSDHQHVIPTSQDLAMSFLESEPARERNELEAAIQSQSYRLSESDPTLEGSPDESGIGMPGGFSLPGFVAKFFAGVADRLSVSIRNVTVSVETRLSPTSQPTETVKIMIKLSELSLDGLQSNADMLHQRSQRSISICGFEVFLLSDAEIFTRPSTTSSPKLMKSRSKLSSISDVDSMRPFESPEQGFSETYMGSRPRQSDTRDGQAELSSEGSTSSSQLADLSVDLGDPLLADSTVFGPTASSSEARSSHTHGRYASDAPYVDNRRHAEDAVVSGVTPYTSSQFPGDTSLSSEDLSESRMFTHDQAQSMYMSAVSHAATISGVLEGAGHARLSPKSSDAFTVPGSTQSGSQGPYRQASSSTGVHDAGDTHLSTKATHTRETIDSASFTLGLIARQLVHIDQLSFSFPASVVNDPAHPAHETPDWPTQTIQPTAKSADPLQAGRIDVSGSRITQSGYVQPSAREFFVAKDYEYTAAIGTVTINLDMAVGRLLVGAASQLNRCLPTQASKDQSVKPPPANFTSRIDLERVSLNICQNITEIGAEEVCTRTYQAFDVDEIKNTCLLQFHLTRLKHELAINPTEKRQHLSIENIVLGHSSQKYLYFANPVSVRDSMAASSVLRPHDVVVTNIDDRYEVHVKPAHAVVDLLKVDEVLSRSGGLSSILDLGNSIMSTGTVTDTVPKAKTSPVRQRAVHFDNSLSRKRADSNLSTSGVKIDVRISGAVIDLIGSESSVQVRSSAIKLVSRAGNFRAQIDTIMLAGPILGRSQTKPGVNVKIVNFSLQFKDAPEEEDLERLLSLLTPSSDKYDDGDNIMVDTLIRQRRKGAVLRLNVNEIKVDISGVSWLKHVTKLADELSNLATVTKYLPEDDRPGILTFILINRIGVNVDLGRTFGILHVHADLAEGATISVPPLMALQISGLSAKRGQDTLLGTVTPESQNRAILGHQTLMCRFIADEMEPTIRIKLSDVCFEYTIPTIVAITDLLDTLKLNNPRSESEPSATSSDVSSSPSIQSDFTRRVQLSLVVRDSAIALNPENSTARALILLSDTVVTHSSRKQTSNIHLDLRKASVLIVDDTAKLGHESANADHQLYFEENDQVQELTKAGYVPVGFISNASASVVMTEEKITHNPLVDVEFRNNLFLLETCADSTQTLIQILSNLAPPSPPSPLAKYRTEIVPIQDMLASFTGNAFVTEEGPELGLEASQVSASTTRTDNYEDDDEDDEYDQSDIGLNNLYETDDDDHDRMTESYLESELSQSRMTGSLHIAPVNPTASPDPPLDQSIMAHSMLDFRTDHFVNKSNVGGTAHRWNSTQNTYGLGSESRTRDSPLKIRLRDMHIIWNLFDGYDWQNTRDTISQAVKDIEAKAVAKRARRDSRRSPGAEEDESVIGDFLFNSIYIGIPATRDPRELTTAVNQDIGDLASETGSYATGTTVTASPSGRGANTRSKPKKLRLNRSRQHKLTFELKGVSADVIAFPPGSGEVESSTDIRIKMLEIFDHVPTSTWKKFATYMHEAGEREVDTSMIHIEMLNVKPVAELSASEIVLKLTVLPLRLHVDQDALDFMTRFFEFKDERAHVPKTPSAPPFLQRVEVNPIRLRLDFKPKRVDYAGLRSGRTTEFMNFFVLDRADMVLRRVILYGVSGLDRLGIMLNNIWSPDVRKNQLPTVLAGLAPIRSIVDVGSGVKDLVAVPIREYKKDGRIVRSIQKGAIAFAKTTTTELVNLGAKLAIGTQTVLQNAEDVLSSKPSQNEGEEGEREQISLYADQPVGVVQGLRGAYASLERDLLLAKDAIVAVPGEVMASGSAAGAAKAILKQSPTIILRPAIGATKAVGQTLLGAGNTLDRGNLRRIEDKYKHR